MASQIERGFAASQWLYDYLEPVVENRRAEPQEDLISLLAHAELDGQRLTNDEIIAFCRLLLPAGAETTYRAASNMMVGLLSNPDQLDAVRADRSLVTAAVEEALRWEAPLTGISRTATADAVVDGIEVRAGTAVNTSLGSANHDPSRWDDPEVFDIFRQPKSHIAFATRASPVPGNPLGPDGDAGGAGAPARPSPRPAPRPRCRTPCYRRPRLPSPRHPLSVVGRLSR